MNFSNTRFRFEKVDGTQEQIEMLYSFLSKRSYSISHKNLPSPESHKHFVLFHPSRAWFIVFEGEEFHGSFYLQKDNSIGVNLLRQTDDIIGAIVNYIKGRFDPYGHIPSVTPPFFYINVAHSNSEMQEILINKGLKALQISYQLPEGYLNDTDQ